MGRVRVPHPAEPLRETIDGIANHSWSCPAPSTPEGEVVSWADRVAYVCHDWEDAVLAGIVAPHQLPASVRQRCGDARSTQLGAFIDGVVSATLRTGQVGMEDDTAEALAAFRACNYERIYLREASVRQGTRSNRCCGRSSSTSPTGRTWWPNRGPEAPPTSWPAAKRPSAPPSPMWPA